MNFHSIPINIYHSLNFLLFIFIIIILKSILTMNLLHFQFISYVVKHFLIHLIFLIFLQYLIMSDLFHYLLNLNPIIIIIIYTSSHFF